MGPYPGAVPSVDALLEQLAAANARVADSQAARDQAMSDRDQIVRDLREGGAGWDAIEATGVSRATIAKALRGR